MNCTIDLDQADLIGTHGGITYRKATVVFANGEFYAHWHDWPNTPGCHVLQQQAIIDAQERQLGQLQQLVASQAQRLAQLERTLPASAPEPTIVRTLPASTPQLPAPRPAPTPAAPLPPIAPCPHCERAAFRSKQSRTMHILYCRENPDRIVPSGARRERAQEALAREERRSVRKIPHAAPGASNGHQPDEEALHARPLA